MKQDVVDALRATLKERDRLRKENSRLLDSAFEPIAIIGMSCRFPGGVASPRDLWGLVAEGRDAITGFPTDRGWDLERLYDPNPDNLGTCSVREGGFLADIAGFDSGFFGISPREALLTDPQQRLLLESSWEALEDAGIDPTGLRGTRAGVFAGVALHDYGFAKFGIAAGMTSSVVSGRVSYTLGLEGPAVSVDTACSSSLVTLHLACQALRGGECTLALAGGVTTLATPSALIAMSTQRALSPDGRCKAFAESADGAGFSEGLGMLALERLSDARANGHPVLAMVRGSAVNQDGASNGLSAPNGPSQERVIRQALDSARLAPADVDLVEAHGTGTTLGDPIEAGALLATYGQDREAPLRLGSLKSNIGHTQAAAGVAGVIKAVMAMREETMPKTLHVDLPSSKIEWESGDVELLTEAVEWGRNGRPRRAAVSSFSYSGTNAHVVLEEAPGPLANEEEDAPPAPVALPGPILLPLSAKSPGALRESAARLAAHLDAEPELDPVDASFSLATTRPLFERRAVVVGEDREELLAALRDLAADGEAGAGLATGVVRSGQAPVFLFPGQGSQWEGMAKELCAASPLFDRSLEECEQALSPHIDFSVRDVLLASEGAPSVERVEVIQPALFTMTVSLARLWEACGVRPAATIGHSQGEIVAAHVCGALSLEDAARISALRSQLIAKLTGKGEMVSVAVSADAARELIEPWAGKSEVAAHNGPSSTIVSAAGGIADELLAHCEREGVRVRKIPAGQSLSHCSYVEPLRDELLEAIAPIAPRSGEIPFHSTVTGSLLDTAELGPEYWYRNMRQPVLFEETVRELARAGKRAFLEISPHPIFAPAVEETLHDELPEDERYAVLPTLRRKEGSPKRFALSLAQAHASGVEPDWSAYFEGTGAKSARLPTYPFQRKRYWIDGAAGAGNLAGAGLGVVEHPLLSAAIDDPQGEGLTFTGRVSLQTHPWLKDHATGGVVLFPGTGFVELALRAGQEVQCEQIAELTLAAPLILPEQGAVQLQVSVEAPAEGGERGIQIHSRPEPAEGERVEWVQNASGTLAPDAVAASPPLEAWPPEGAEPLDAGELYDRLAEAGFEYGPSFQGLTRAWQHGEEVLAEVSLAEEQAMEAGAYGLHPALLDASLHAVALAASLDEGPGGLVLPFAWSGVSLFAAGASELRVRLRRREAAVTLAVADAAGNPLAQIETLSVRPVSEEQLRAGKRDGLGLLGIEWHELRAEGGSGEVVELQDDLAALLEGEGEAPATVLWRCGGGDDEGESVPERARQIVATALDLLQRWIAAPELANSRLAVLTPGAVAAREGERPDPATAAVWGLVRSAQSEHPGRFQLIDSDGTEASEEALPGALALAEEPQLALREGTVAGARAIRQQPEAAGDAASPFDPERTVLITGATGALGGLTAKHLVEAHGARHLLLVSRSGEKADGAKEMAEELEELGAEVTIAACDAADRAALERLFAEVPGEHPVGAVVHCAAVLEDATIETLTAEQLDPVFAPKVDAAWHLHELSSGLDLSAFVCFSSAAGTIGSPGQGNYAAANAFLDALTQQRRAEGLVATSIAWGLWESTGGPTGKLEEADMARLRRSGVAAISDERGLALFDDALACARPDTVAIELDPGALRTMASAGLLPPLLSGLVRVPKRRATPAGSLARKLAELPEDEREAHVLGVVRGEVAAILGHDSADEIEADRAFQELGFDSLSAVELRNRLAATSGLRLSPTVVFDYPTAKALAAHLLAEVSASPAAKVAVRAQASDEPIAIVGMGCRYPGDVDSPRALWELVAAGEDAIGGLPTDRGWDLERLYDPDPSHLGTSYVREGGFLSGAADFDPEFFGISPYEALVTDPQERLLLEGAWEALEDAGIDPGSLRGTAAGVFAGVMSQDYSAPEFGISPGMTTSIASGRISYTLGLEGPAMTVDTACSSSLVALHLACQALRAGECTLALAGGVTVLTTPSVLIGMSAQRGLSPDGRSKSFAEAADGVGTSEGLGVLVLERLSAARANRHRVLATIRGSAVNQDGASNGLTAPNGPSQERVIRQALANARLTPQEVDAVEAHGTGTVLGDPIEAGALIATYGQEREAPLRLGSLKSNIGHAQAAAGVGGVIKTVMAMRAGVLPKTLHADEPSTKIDWEAGQVELLNEPEPWQSGSRPRRAGVSSFGISGTNAHLILEEAPAPEAGDSAGDEGPGASSEEASAPTPALLPLSAKSEEALRAQAERLASHLRQHPELDPTDVSFSLATTRFAFEHRAVAVGEGAEELAASLTAIAQGSPEAIAGRAREGKLAYLFTGQGSQRAGMGRELYESSPVYREELDRLLAELDPHLERPLTDLLFAEPGSEEAELLGLTTYAQPALFATEVALYRLLESRGLKATLLAGHSIGEIAAAHVSGIFDAADAAKLVGARARLMGDLPSGGAMLAVQATEGEAAEAIADREQELSIAAINGPRAIVLSGSQEAIEEHERLFGEKERKTKRLAVSHAFHSALMEPMLAPFEEVARSIAYREPAIPIVSNASGELLGEEQAQDPAYWVAHVRQPVLFAKGIATLLDRGATAFVELGPEPALVPMAAQCTEGEERPPALIGTLREGVPEREAVASALARAQASGAKLDWRAYFGGCGAKAVELPTYAFQRKRYWIGSQGHAANLSAAGLSEAEHPLLGAALAVAGEGQLLLTGRLSLQSHPWLADHAVAAKAQLPRTALLELALAAARQAGCEQVAELTFAEPLVLPAQGAVQVQVSVGVEDEEGSREVRVHSRAEAEDEEPLEWALNATGVISPEAPEAPAPLEVWPPEGAEELDAEFLYDRLAEAGFEYGLAFQGLARAWRRGGEVYAEASLAEEQAREAGRYGIHPALLDAALHAVALASEPFAPQLSQRWGGVGLAGSASTLRAGLVPVEGEGAYALAAHDGEGNPVASARLVAMAPAEGVEKASAQRSSLFRVEWSEVGIGDAGEAGTGIAVLGDEVPGVDGELYPDLAALIEATASAPPQVVVAALRSGGGGGTAPQESGLAAERALDLVLAWLAEERLARSRLVLVGEGAVSAGDDPPPDLAAATAWGLVRSAQSEHPGRIGLLDDDGTAASRAALALALSLSEEPQLALREGVALAPRLARAPAAEDATTAPPLDPDSTVLITGGTGAGGALAARHLVAERGARRLLLASRGGDDASGARELVAELEELGAEVTVASCDVSDRESLAALLDSIPAERPLGAVVHAARVLDGGVLESLDAERLERALQPQLEAAWHLHELTEGAGLQSFVLFSSAAGTLGSPGLAGYAAATSFLDALARRRRHEGLPAVSVAWGPPMDRDRALELLGATLDAGEPHLLPIELDRERLRAQAKAGTLPPILRGLVGTARRQAKSDALVRRLSELPEEARDGAVLDLVRSHAASILGHESAASVEPDRAFQELGFDSVGAVELRNRLAAATDLRLPATLVFDHPSPRALAKFLRAEAEGSERVRAVAAQPALASEEPVAIVGMGCRYPGGADSPESFWQLLSEGRDAIGDFPDDRGWGAGGPFPHGEEGANGFSPKGGFIDDVADFDPGFFGISPREAIAIDPQQRLLLETAWETLEDAGIDPGLLRGSGAGVFVGASSGDYAYVIGATLSGSPIVGAAASIISGRLAYTLGLEGPAMTVDTACSSSLVALHLACQALRSGECSLALAGGTSVISTPLGLMDFGAQGGLSADGRCKAFAEGADGTGFAEGAGVLALERLADAKANGHEILALISGSAVNQDGASNGLTAPNGPSQERVIRQALANARLTPGDVDAVEAHGTGTVLGDPIEAGALLSTYGQERERPLKLGSVKSNIGHSVAAAGVAGVIKTVMAMREGMLPRTLHAGERSSRVDWEAGEIELLTEAVPWQPNGRPRRAGVSSFGISGTNAHVIIEEAPRPTESGGEGPGDRDDRRGDGIPTLLPLSAKSAAALRVAAARLAARLGEDPELSPTDVSFSLATSRAAFEHRAVAVGASAEELRASLAAIANGDLASIAARAREGKLAYLFTGQGSQRAGMGRELYESSPVYREELDRLLAELDPHLERPLADLLFAEPGSEEAELLGLTTYAQPALFATEVALYRLLESLGLKPDLLGGHSIGEISAAHVAGVFDAASAARLVAARATLMGALPAEGAMLAVQASAADAGAAIEGRESELSVAAINGPDAVVLSGAKDAVVELAERFAAEGRKTKRLAVSHAFHSPLMEPMLGEFEEVAKALAYAEPKIPIVSNASGEMLTGAQATDPAYWVAHVRQPVCFAQGVATLAKEGTTAFLELGPDAVLTAMADHCLENAVHPPATIPTLREGRDERAAIAGALAQAHAAGAKIDWRTHFEGSGARRVKLPTYPFQRQRYWLEMPSDFADPIAIARAAAERPPEAELEDPGPSLRERLDGVPEEEHGEVVFGLVNEQVAAVLAHEAPIEIDPDREFVELGFDSLGAVELRKRLVAVTGLALPSYPLGNSPTVASVAADVLARLAGGQGEGGRGEAAPFVRLADGPDLPSLVLIPSALAVSGPHEYARFAAPFRGHRTVFGIPLPGFSPGDALPVDVKAAAEQLAEAVLGIGLEPDFALVGHSSGGWLAHAVAAKLEDAGVPPASVVMLDSAWPGGEVLDALLPRVFTGIKEAERLGLPLDDDRLLAMGAYMRMFREWQPSDIAARTVVLRARDETWDAALGADGLKLTGWQLPHSSLEVEGDHFTMMQDHAPATAEAVRSALETETANRD